MLGLKEIRQTFGKSQKEMADLLGISVRAIQSYEQRWRAIPSSINKLAHLLLYLRWRNSDSPKNATPCWEICGCDPADFRQCPAYRYGAGEFCWLVTGDYRQGEKMPSWAAKLEKCRDCPVATSWLSANGSLKS